MQISYAGLSSAGPVRSNNEDCLNYWQPTIADDWRARGAVAILADGVGGHGKGEVASRIACDQALASVTRDKAGRYAQSMPLSDVYRGEYRGLRRRHA